MKSLKILSLAFLVPIAAVADEIPGPQAFLAKVGLSEGDYELVEKDSAEDCFTGGLRVTGEKGDFTLMLGAHPLASSLGKETAETYSERGCEYEEKAQIADKRIEWTKTADCRKNKNLKSVLFFHTVIEPMKDGGFNYRSTVREKKAGAKELTKVQNCVYKPGAED